MMNMFSCVFSSWPSHSWLEYIWLLLAVLGPFLWWPGWWAPLRSARRQRHLQNYLKKYPYAQVIPSPMPQSPQQLQAAAMGTWNIWGSSFWTFVQKFVSLVQWMMLRSFYSVLFLFVSFLFTIGQGFTWVYQPTVALLRYLEDMTTTTDPPPRHHETPVAVDPQGNDLASPRDAQPPRTTTPASVLRSSSRSVRLSLDRSHDPTQHHRSVSFAQDEQGALNTAYYYYNPEDEPGQHMQSHLDSWRGDQVATHSPEEQTSPSFWLSSSRPRTIRRQLTPYVRVDAASPSLNGRHALSEDDLVPHEKENWQMMMQIQKDDKPMTPLAVSIYPPSQVHTTEERVARTRRAFTSTHSFREAQYTGSGLTAMDSDTPLSEQLRKRKLKLHTLPSRDSSAYKRLAQHAVRSTRTASVPWMEDQVRRQREQRIWQAVTASAKAAQPNSLSESSVASDTPQISGPTISTTSAEKSLTPTFFQFGTAGESQPGLEQAMAKHATSVPGFQFGAVTKQPDVLASEIQQDSTLSSQQGGQLPDQGPVTNNDSAPFPATLNVPEQASVGFQFGAQPASSTISSPPAIQFGMSPNAMSQSPAISLPSVPTGTPAAAYQTSFIFGSTPQNTPQPGPALATAAPTTPAVETSQVSAASQPLTFQPSFQFGSTAENTPQPGPVSMPTSNSATFTFGSNTAVDFGTVPLPPSLGPSQSMGPAALSAAQSSSSGGGGSRRRILRSGRSRR